MGISFRVQVELEDDNTAVPRTHIDDEYAHAGERDPKILITTSRDPSSRWVGLAAAAAIQARRNTALRLAAGGRAPWLLLRGCCRRCLLVATSVCVNALIAPAARRWLPVSVLPARRLVQFAKEVKLLFPNAQRVNRGSMVRRAGCPLALRSTLHGVHAWLCCSAAPG